MNAYHAIPGIVAAVVVVGGVYFSENDIFNSLTLRGNIVPLKDAKLNIEHNASDNDTGFQGFVDGEGWKELTFKGPDGTVLEISGEGTLGTLGLTELFFETVEPANVDVSIEEMMKMLPEGSYTIEGPTVEDGKVTGHTQGTAWLTHTIPSGPVLVSPKAEAIVPAENNLVVEWQPVTTSLDGKSINIIAYELIIQKDQPQHPHMIGKRGLDIHLPATVTRIIVPKGFLEAGSKYKWEVLAIEESGNQTLSSGEFSTR